MSAPSARLAVVEDDTVLCADCVDELHAEGVYETAGTIVHAWLADLAGQGMRLLWHHHR